MPSITRRMAQLNAGRRLPESPFLLQQQLHRMLHNLRIAGGQLYMAGPANNEFIDNSGAAPDGIGTDPIGYVRDLVSGTGSATQTTTAAKPKLVREPILGPELVVNGDFSNGTTGWGASNVTFNASGGEATVTVTSSSSPSIFQPLALTVGSTYLVQGSERMVTGAGTYWWRRGTGSYPGLSGLATTSTTMVRRSASFVADASSEILYIKPLVDVGASAIFDSISVREILGYKDVWSWEFDGTDDRLVFAPPSSLAGASVEGVLFCCAVTRLTAATGVRVLAVGTSTDSSLLYITQSSGSAMQFVVKVEGGSSVYPAPANLAVGETAVLSGWIVDGAARIRKNGVGFTSSAVTGSLGSALVGMICAHPSGSYGYNNCRMQAPVIASGITDLAQVQQIERVVAAAAGVTLP